MSVTERPGRTRRQIIPDWLKPVHSDSPDGTMALVDHLRELRYRVIMSFIAFLVIAIAALVVENTTHWLSQFAIEPLNQAIAAYRAKYPDRQVLLTTDGVMGAFTLQMKIAAVSALIISCPVWLWHLWAFIMPGLLANEKKYAVRFLGAAIPLFLAGVAVGYLVMPKGFAVMLGFNPPNTTNINDVSKYLTFELQMLLVFGLSFLLPVVLVGLNLLGIVRARTLAKSRTVAIFACFIFAALATPSTDPLSMLALSAPMAVMYLIAEVICSVNDKRLVASGKLVELDLDED